MIYIACPENFATGGTELLHQLYYHLKHLTEDVRIFYYNYSGKVDPTPERFKKYNVEYVTQIDDNKENALIIPEVSTDLLKSYPLTKKIIWWLSIDNYYIARGYSKIPHVDIKHLWSKRIKKGIKFKDKEVIHLVQSYYALDFLKRKGVKNISYLSDYIGDNIIDESLKRVQSSKKDIILYNPKKGWNITEKLISHAPELKFQPLENMSQDEIIEHCNNSKIYIDFGNHPGKDRFPREAALFNCLIITGKEGSAAFYEDVPISERYKIIAPEVNINKTISLLKESLKNYTNLIHEQDNYRSFILNEKEQFIDDIKKNYTRYLEK